MNENVMRPQSQRLRDMIPRMQGMASELAEATDALEAAEARAEKAERRASTAEAALSIKDRHNAMDCTAIRTHLEMDRSLLVAALREFADGADDDAIAFRFDMPGARLYEQLRRILHETPDPNKEKQS